MSAKLTLKKSISLCSMAFITAVMVLCFMGANAQSKVKETNKRGTKKVDAKSERMREREEEEREEKEKDGPAQILERDIMMMKDPALGYVPTERLLDAKKYKDHLMQQAFAPIGGVSWKEQGPINQGGRSRAIMVDPNDGTGNTVWAGSVGGGLWKTTNINSATPNWTPVNDLASNLAVTSIAYDPSNPLIMYFATGEGYNNSDAIRGLGVWKSTDGGAIWAQLASTNIGTFNFCQKVVVNSTGIVLVATASGGLQRSSNGGTTWTKVLGTGLGITGAASNFCYDVDIAANGDVYATLDGSVHKSTNAGVTFAAAQTLGITASRIELACAPSDANYVYALVENGNVVNGILQTTNGGTSWTLRTEPADADPGIPATDFSRGQAWYDLTIAVDPNNRDRLFAGGIDLFLSADGAGTWTQVSHWYGGFGFQYTHADQHNIVFQNGSSSVAYFVNDGGVFRSTNANVATPTIDNRGTNYRTTQFYSCAMHPTTQTPYYLAGAQDNGTHQFKLSGLQATTEVTGGDGAWCHIDQDQPQFQFTQYVFNDYYRSSDGGSTWTNVTFGGTGQFINPTDYDDLNNKMYAANNSNQYLRWDDPQTGATFVTIAAAALNGQVSAVKVSPNTANRVFFGSVSGRVIMVDNANTATPTITNISTGLPGGAYVSCVEVETGNDNHLLATFSNYGVNSVWESTNGGTSWTSVEGNLPDMPIRWALFNPNNNDQTIIATELGVWSTDNLNAGATVWGASNSGLANVRVDMLQLRQSDKFVIAATHGRGLYTSDLFTTPTAIFSSDIQLAYINSSIQFTNESYQSTSWSWNFGDGSPLSTAENPSHTYTTAGKFNVTLTINAGASTLTKTQYIQILPNRGTPYVVATDGSTFEINPDDFGSQAIRGGINKWELGVPTNFLTTVNSPVNVWKTDLDADLTSGDYACVLQTPSYNFSSSASAYTLRFRRSMEIAFCNGPFAVQLQYSTDKGLTWTRLGVNADPAATNWYNRGPATGCPVDVAVFADQYGWTLTANNTLCTYNITTGAPALVGQSDVTFRFVLSVEPGFPAGGYAVDGFMIDDFEILGPVNSAIGGASITTTGVLIPFVSCQGSVSAEQSFTVSGTGLTANLLVTPPTGFEVSLTSGSGFASSLSFTPSSGSVPTTTIFVRLTAAASGTPSGNIACTSTGATTQDVAVSGTVYNPTLTVNAQTNVSCFGGTNGAASVNAAAGGLAPYSYNWTPGNPAGDGTVSVTGLTAGSWTCTVTDNNGCTSSISFIITDPTVIVANCSGTNVSCNGGNNGSASVSASGGTGTLTYLWNNSNTNSSISGLTAGTYTVTVTDANGCTQTCAYTVTQPTTIVANCSGTNVSINGGSDGSASVAASGGTGTLTYLWSNANTNSSITGLIAGTYTVTVKDANLCTVSCTYTVTQPSALSITCTGTNNLCFGGTSGSASVTVNSGNSPYTYSWSNSNTNASITGLSAGTYTVTVTDVTLATASCSYTVTQGTAITLTNAATNATSCVTNNGAINLSVSGSVPCGANSKGLLIAKIFANPAGTDSTFEFIQLVATKNIDFSVTPYTVFFSNNGVATVNGWKAGAAITYAFEINTGTALAGGIYYVGGINMVPLTNRLRAKNSATTAGDGGIGNASNSGVLGNGGTSDGVAVLPELLLQ
nr:PKD domain-containing protein [Bacteroidota bacterium]